MADEQTVSQPGADAAVTAISNIMNPQRPEGEPSEEVVEEQEEAPAAEAEAEPSEEGAEEPDGEEESPQETIDPPLSWSDADKKVFSTLPPETQKVIVSREREREAHLTRSNQAAAESRKQYSAEAQALAQERQHITSVVVPLLSQMAGELNSEAQVIQQLLDAGDVSEAMRRKMVFDQKREQFQQTQAEMQRMQEQDRRQQEFQLKERVAEEGKRLLEAIPSWSDAKVARQDKADLREYLMNAGFTEGEVGQIIDHRVVKVALDALRYDRVHKSRPMVTQKVTPKSPTTRPGSAKPKPDKRATQYAAGMSALKKNPKDRDALANVFKGIL